MDRASGIRTRALWQRAITVAHGAGGGGGAEGGKGGSGGGSTGGSMFRSRSTGFQALAASLVDQKNREKDLKAKHEELEDTKRKLDQEKDSKQKLQKQFQSTAASLQDATAKLQRSQDSVERARLENKKKTEQVEKLERNISQMEDRIRNLEIRASEVEKAELTLDSTRRNLESSQYECRAKESEISRLQDKYDKTCLELDSANGTIKDMQKKIEDLRHQVRHELMKNENIERGLETIPHLKDDLADRDKKIAELEKETGDKSALLTSARKAVRDYKDRIRDLEREEAAGESQKRELDIAQQEVQSLKNLMAGKDALILRKSQALEQAKLVIESLPRTQDEKEKMKKIQQLITRLAASHNDNHIHVNGFDVNGNRGKPPLTPRSRALQENGRELSVDTSPFQHRDSDYNLLERCLQENQHQQHHHNHHHSQPHQHHPKQHQHRAGGHVSSTTVTQTAVVHPVRRTSSFNELLQSHLHHPPAPSGRGRQGGAAPQSRAHSRGSHHSRGGGGGGGDSSRPATSMSSSNVYRPETRAVSRFPPSLDYNLGGGGGDGDQTDAWVHATTNNHHNNNNHSNCNNLAKKSANQPQQRPYSALTGGSRLPSAVPDEEDDDLRDDYADEYHLGGSLSDSDSDTGGGMGGGGGGEGESEGSRDERALARLQLTARQKDEILASAISVGDRVSLTVPQRPPRYGRKKPKPIVYTGIVKYTGRLDKQSYDARIYCGLRLDEPIGEKDGVYRGKRYMFTPLNHAKFFKIRDLCSILDVKSGQYQPACRLLLKHLKKSQSFHRDREEVMHQTM